MALALCLLALPGLAATPDGRKVNKKPPAKLAVKPAPPPSQEDLDKAARESEAIIANFSLSNIKLTNTRESGATDDTVRAFEGELSRRLAERMATSGSDPTIPPKSDKGTVEVRFDKVIVQGDMVRGKEGEPIPQDMFAATVRVLDSAGQEVSLYIIPETQIRGDRLIIDNNRLLGVEGAAIVYRRLFGGR